LTAAGRPWLAPLLAAVAGLLAYAVTLRGTFVYDDVAMVLLDKRVAEPGGFGRLWTEHYNGSAERPYRPLVSTSYWLQYRLHGPTAWPYHAFNVALHAVVCAQVAVRARPPARRRRRGARR